MLAVFGLRWKWDHNPGEASTGSSTYVDNSFAMHDTHSKRITATQHKAYRLNIITGAVLIMSNNTAELCAVFIRLSSVPTIERISGQRVE